jgi:hypothetical protein
MRIMSRVGKARGPAATPLTLCPDRIPATSIPSGAISVPKNTIGASVGLGGNALLGKAFASRIASDGANRLMAEHMILGLEDRQKGDVHGQPDVAETNRLDGFGARGTSGGP